MNILFLSISAMPHMSEHSISLDLLHEFKRRGHNVYTVSALPHGTDLETNVSDENGITALRVKIGKNKKANPIVKGITTVLLPSNYISAIKKYYADVKFDLVMCPTPPVTIVDVVQFVKKRDGAKSYLLLKDIFPQNAVDIGMMSKSGVKGIIYSYFRKKEKKLYAISDYIGCMSQANVEYLLKHNPEISPEKVEICPNAIEVYDKSIDSGLREELRNKYKLPLDKKVFIYGGNLSKPQGIPFLIECLKAQKDNNDAYFAVVGDGTDYKKLEAFFEEEKPLNMKLMKRLPKEDYDLMVAACDVGMIFLDHRFTIPNFPSRILAYMQAKIPVIACTDPNSDIGQVITEGGFGYWCESNDVNAFSECVDSLIKTDLSVMCEREFAYLEEYYNVERSYRTIMARVSGEEETVREGVNDKLGV